MNANMNIEIDFLWKYAHVGLVVGNCLKIHVNVSKNAPLEVRKF